MTSTKERPTRPSKEKETLPSWRVDNAAFTMLHNFKTRLSTSRNFQAAVSNVYLGQAETKPIPRDVYFRMDNIDWRVRFRFTKRYQEMIIAKTLGRSAEVVLVKSKRSQDVPIEDAAILYRRVSDINNFATSVNFLEKNTQLAPDSAARVLARPPIK